MLKGIFLSKGKGQDDDDDGKQMLLLLLLFEQRLPYHTAALYRWQASRMWPAPVISPQETPYEV